MELTRDDFVREIGWVLYSNRKTLPESVDIEAEEPLAEIPTDVLQVLTDDWNDPDVKHFAADIASHYNWTMFCILEDTYELDQA